jgi:diphosphoinositol-polyphosphate diphosphatase
VLGETGPALGRWCYRSRSYDATYEGFVLPLRVTAELDRWPEMAARRREWVSAAEAIARCPHPWMREALQRFSDTVAVAAETMHLASAL